MTLRWKRGTIDTGLPGGFYKDQAYLEGAVAILKNRNKIDFKGLYCGKISLEDLGRDQIQKKLNRDDIKLPPFMDNMKLYMHALDIIARTNHID